MTQKSAMAAEYTQVSMKDMETFLKRAFRILKPTLGVERGEQYFMLKLSPSTGIRVLTSIGSGREIGAGVGQDAIRVQLFSTRKNKPLKPGKAPIVKRTQNWRDSLKDRVEDAMDDYDAHEEEIEAGKFIQW